MLLTLRGLPPDVKMSEICCFIRERCTVMWFLLEGLEAQVDGMRCVKVATMSDADAAILCRELSGERLGTYTLSVEPSRPAEAFGINCQVLLPGGEIKENEDSPDGFEENRGQLSGKSKVGLGKRSRSDGIDGNSMGKRRCERDVSEVGSSSSHENGFVAHNKPNELQGEDEIGGDNVIRADKSEHESEFVGHTDPKESQGDGDSGGHDAIRAKSPHTCNNRRNIEHESEFVGHTDPKESQGDGDSGGHDAIRAKSPHTCNNRRNIEHESEFVGHTDPKESQGDGDSGVHDAIRAKSPHTCNNRRNIEHESEFVGHTDPKESQGDGDSGVHDAIRAKSPHTCNSKRNIEHESEFVGHNDPNKFQGNDDSSGHNVMRANSLHTYNNRRKSERESEFVGHNDPNKFKGDDDSGGHDDDAMGTNSPHTYNNSRESVHESGFVGHNDPNKFKGNDDSRGQAAIRANSPHAYDDRREIPSRALEGFVCAGHDEQYEEGYQSVEMDDCFPEAEDCNPGMDRDQTHLPHGQRRFGQNPELSSGKVPLWPMKQKQVKSPRKLPGQNRRRPRSCSPSLLRGTRPQTEIQPNPSECPPISTQSMWPIMNHGARQIHLHEHRLDLQQIQPHFNPPNQIGGLPPQIDSVNQAWGIQILFDRPIQPMGMQSQFNPRVQLIGIPPHFDPTIQHFQSMDMASQFENNIQPRGGQPQFDPPFQPMDMQRRFEPPFQLMDMVPRIDTNTRGMHLRFNPSIQTQGMQHPSGPPVQSMSRPPQLNNTIQPIGIQPQFGPPIQSMITQPRSGPPVQSMGTQPRFGLPVQLMGMPPQLDSTNQPIGMQPRFGRPFQSMGTQPQFDSPAQLMGMPPQHHSAIQPMCMQRRFDPPVQSMDTQPRSGQPVELMGMPPQHDTTIQPIGMQPRFDPPVQSMGTQPRFGPPVQLMGMPPQLDSTNQPIGMQSRFGPPVQSMDTQPRYGPPVQLMFMPTQHDSTMQTIGMQPRFGPPVQSMGIHPRFGPPPSTNKETMNIVCKQLSLPEFPVPLKDSKLNVKALYKLRKSVAFDVIDEGSVNINMDLSAYINTNIKVDADAYNRTEDDVKAEHFRINSAEFIVANLLMPEDRGKKKMNRADRLLRPHLEDLIVAELKKLPREEFVDSQDSYGAFLVYHRNTSPARCRHLIDMAIEKFGVDKYNGIFTNKVYEERAMELWPDLYIVNPRDTPATLKNKAAERIRKSILVHVRMGYASIVIASEVYVYHKAEYQNLEAEFSTDDLQQGMRSRVARRLRELVQPEVSDMSTRALVALYRSWHPPEGDARLICDVIAELRAEAAGETDDTRRMQTYQSVETASCSLANEAAYRRQLTCDERRLLTAEQEELLTWLQSVVQGRIERILREDNSRALGAERIRAAYRAKFPWRTDGALVRAVVARREPKAFSNARTTGNLSGVKLEAWRNSCVCQFADEVLFGQQLNKEQRRALSSEEKRQTKVARMLVQRQFERLLKGGDNLVPSYLHLRQMYRGLHPKSEDAALKARVLNTR